MLIRDKRSSARKYYKSHDTTSTTKKNAVTITSRAAKPQEADDRSDKSILGAPAPGRVVLTNEISVKYQDRSENDSIGNYEMDNV